MISYDSPMMPFLGGVLVTTLEPPHSATRDRAEDPLQFWFHQGASGRIRQFVAILCSKLLCSQGMEDAPGKHGIDHVLEHLGPKILELKLIDDGFGFF